MKSDEKREKGSRAVRRLSSAAAAALICLSVSLPAAASGTGRVYRGTTGDDSLFYMKPFEFRVSLNFDWFILGDNTVYFNELAGFSAVFSNAAYGETGGSPTQETDEISGDGIAFCEAVGLQDAAFLEVRGDGEFDENDNTVLLIGHRLCESGGKTYEILFAAARGSVTGQDWLSNADVGADTEAYRELTGEHPEWTDTSMHKGFAVTAARAAAAIETYADSFLTPGAERIILLTGHSRGAAVANILGKWYGEKEDYKAFTYTFASPRTTTCSAEEAAAPTVFNLINEDDVVPELPAENWSGFRRYGTDIFGSADDYQSAYKRITGETYLTADGQWVTEPFSSLIESREALYEFDTEDGYVLWDSFSSREEGEEGLQELLSEMEADGVAEYFRVELRETAENGENVFCLGYSFRPAYVTEILAELLSVENVLDLLLNFDYYPFSDSYTEAGKEFLVPALDGSFLKSHMPAAYYCIATQRKDRHSGRFLTTGEYLMCLAEEYRTLLIAAGIGTAGAACAGWQAVRQLKKKRRLKKQKTES